MESQNIMGFGFYWFQAVVEDRLDPLKLGRVRIRVLGIHTEDKTRIPTEELPWAYPLSPLTSAAMNGIGETPLGPVEGTWVFGFFRDGDSCQEPVIIGTLTGIPQEYPYPKSKRIGFLDPREDLSTRPRKYLKPKQYPTDGTGAILENEDPSPPTGESYPRQKHPYGIIVGESDMNRLARNEFIEDTIIQLKKDSRVFGIPIADGTTWDEPQTPYDSVYPYNHVIETESGHVFEVDDSPGNERIHDYHKSGTFTEIYADGIKVEKRVGNSYLICMEETYQHHMNRTNITIDGPFNVYVRNNAKIIITGDADVEVGGDYNVKVHGDYNVTAGGDVNIKGNDTTIGAASTVSLKGSSVKAYPYVDKAFQSARTTIDKVPFTPNPGGSQSNGVSVDTVTLSRTYPREIPTYPITTHP